MCWLVRRTLCLVAGVVLVSVAGASGGPLFDLDIGHLPRVYATDVQVTYVADGRSVRPELPAGQGLLVIDGSPYTVFEQGGPSEGTDLFPGVFYAEVVIDTSTGEAVGGMMNITGASEDGGAAQNLFHSTTLATLPNSLPAFGVGGNDIFDIVFLQDATTPSLAPAGASVGIKIYAESIPDALFSESHPPDFSADFANGLNYVLGSGNAFYLPEPATLSLLVIGALAVVRRRRP